MQCKTAKGHLTLGDPWLVTGASFKQKPLLAHINLHKFNRYQASSLRSASDD